MADHADEPDLGTRLALTVSEAAVAVGVSERHLRDLLPSLPMVRLGGRVVIPVELSSLSLCGSGLPHSGKCSPVRSPYSGPRRLAGRAVLFGFCWAMPARRGFRCLAPLREFSRLRWRIQSRRWSAVGGA